MAAHPFNKKSQWRNISFSKPNKKLICSVYPILETRLSPKSRASIQKQLASINNCIVYKNLRPTELTYVSKTEDEIFLE